MLDFSTEEMLALRDAAKIVPRRRGGRRCHTSTLYRWSTNGLRGVVLETLQVGGARFTSREAMRRFFARLTEASIGRRASPPCRSPKDLMKINEELDRLGL